METQAVRICVSVGEDDAGALVQASLHAAELGDLIEIRLDCLSESDFELQFEKVKDSLKTLHGRMILTFRPVEQGGHRRLTHEQRVSFWTSTSLPQECLLDIELDIAPSLCDQRLDWSRVICSHHDFQGTPSRLGQIYERMRDTPARVLKIAFKANDVVDCLPAFQLLERARNDARDMIAIAMGPSGVATRILGPSRSGFLTYGSLTDDTRTAPGQLTALDLKRTYRVDKLTRDTEILGLVGLPTGHSMSPYVHNAAFDAAGFDSVYMRFEVRDLHSFMTRMIASRSRELDWNVRGLSITAPYKSDVMKYLDSIEPAAKEIGAVNTIVVDAGELHGYNTDAHGFIQPLIKRLGRLSGMHSAVIGAGGVARTAAWILRREGARVKIFARSTDKARTLAEEFALEWDQLHNARFGEFDIVVNATPLGTCGILEAQTIATAAQLRGARLVYDLVYNPAETQLMREAQEAGCEALGGLEMWVTQAIAQFRLWTDVEAPADVMMAEARRVLGQV